ncbi:hypothetical protein NHX12_005879 [Muraenolepis orangiensis]|uniref:Myosin motor domain-containing protein n=1 Tax=Muraenolepis orangiensis TaxID=630683 RepID=A0A9Q0ICL1_9TELE|nr:hypothetical protein NHX12_005879 [Muraenolepis orangiensis]
MAASELYTKLISSGQQGVCSRVLWGEEVWKSAELTKNYEDGDSSLQLQLEDGTNLEHQLDPKTKNLPYLRNPDILVGENDLTALSYLHEPAVLHNLKVRFSDSKLIYTYCAAAHLCGQNMGDMDPHIFAVAEEAYKQMARDERNQSIIVSGESGAGKTVSAKYAMRYFATVSGAASQANVEQKVLASNPIMEAIGNAKTTRNDNSSRFGKYIEIGFDMRYRIIGANMRTYLLEKSRVVFQLCASAHLPEFKALRLSSANEFLYTQQGGSPVISGVDDVKELSRVNESYQMGLFQVLAAILHLGNVEVKDRDSDSSTIPANNSHLTAFCELVGVSYQDMSHWLCHRKLRTATETYIKTVPRLQAVNARDALAKHIYAKLFNWIVEHVNKALVTNFKQHSFIGVLDIYGFETFEINSFEQFCINYANEKLQQQFNMPCINLIEAKMGILDLLDEECKMPKGSDDSWAQKLYHTHLKTCSLFQKPRLSNRAFIIQHFADKVEYQCDGFLEKNKDTVNEEQINVLKASKFDLLVELFQDGEKAISPAAQAAGAGGRTRLSVKPDKSRPSSREHKKTVGCQFRNSLQMLMGTLNATTFDPKRAVQQLRACGVLETIRISAAGFPSRWTYQEFFSRYRVLMKQKDVLPDKKLTCRNVLENLVQDQDKYQFGKTKIFFRAGQVAYLEKLRADKLRVACIRIQKTIRCWLARKKYLRQRSAAITIQRFTRGYQARCLAKFMRRTDAATTIQKYQRMCVARRRYRQKQAAALAMQTILRAYMARQKYQKHVRGLLARRRYKRCLRAVVYLQCCIRRMHARWELKKLKIEARSVEHFKKLNIGMENKIMQLQRRIDEQTKDIRAMTEKLGLLESSHAVESERTRTELTRLRGAEEDARNNANRANTLQGELERLRKELATTQKEKKTIEDWAQKYRDEMEKMVSELKAQNGLLKTEKDDLNILIREQSQQMTEKMARAIVEETQQLETDLNEERSRYQNLLTEHLRLEEKYDDLKEDVALSSSTTKPGHRRRDSTHSSNESEYTYNSEYAESEEGSRASEDTGRGIDTSLTLKLQKRLTELEQDKQQLRDELENKEELFQRARARDDVEHKKARGAELEYESLKELESENKKLKHNLAEMRQSLLGNKSTGAGAPGSPAYKVLLDQLNSSCEELDVRKEEVLILRSQLVSQKEAMQHKDEKETMTEPSHHVVDVSKLKDTDEIKQAYVGLKDTNRSPRFSHKPMEANELLSRLRSPSPDIRQLNEDGELWLVYEGLKETNRLLESQLQAQRRIYEGEQEVLRSELQNVKEENNRQQQLLAQNLQLPPEARIEDLMEHLEKQDKIIRKLKKQLKVYSKRIGEMGAGQAEGQTSPGQVVDEPLRPVNIPRREKDFQGMLEYKKEDELKLVKNLILG